jgi:uncharacterized protein
MKYGLPATVVEKICTILDRYPEVEQAVLYGSRAKGTYRSGSDIDLAIRGTPKMRIEVLLKILDDIDDLLLPYTVDLSIYDQIADPDLIAHIQRVGIAFFERRQPGTDILA